MSDDPKSQPEAEPTTCQPAQSTDRQWVSVSFGECPFSYGTPEYRHWQDTVGKAKRAVALEAAKRRVLAHARGTVIVLEDGDYSDRHMAALLVLLGDVDLNALAQEYIERTSNSHGSEKELRSGMGFGAWLVAQGHAAPVSHEEIHTDEFGGWDE